jgi:hypothetical protein
MSVVMCMALALPLVTYFGIQTACNLNQAEYYTRSLAYPIMN